MPEKPGDKSPEGGIWVGEWKRYNKKVGGGGENAILYCDAAEMIDTMTLSINRHSNGPNALCFKNCEKYNDVVNHGDGNYTFDAPSGWHMESSGITVNNEMKSAALKAADIDKGYVEGGIERVQLDVRYEHSEGPQDDTFSILSCKIMRMTKTYSVYFYRYFLDANHEFIENDMGIRGGAAWLKTVSRGYVEFFKYSYMPGDVDELRVDCGKWSGGVVEISVPKQDGAPDDEDKVWDPDRSPPDIGEWGEYNPESAAAMAIKTLEHVSLDATGVNIISAAIQTRADDMKTTALNLRETYGKDAMSEHLGDTIWCVEMVVSISKLPDAHRCAVRKAISSFLGYDSEC